MLIKGTTEKNRYLITCAEDDRQGYGTFIWPDGSRYEGDFYDGCISSMVPSRGPMAAVTRANGMITCRTGGGSSSG